MIFETTLDIIFHEKNHEERLWWLMLHYIELILSFGKMLHLNSCRRLYYHNINVQNLPSQLAMQSLLVRKMWAI